MVVIALVFSGVAFAVLTLSSRAEPNFVQTHESILNNTRGTMPDTKLGTPSYCDQLAQNQLGGAFSFHGGCAGEGYGSLCIKCSVEDINVAATNNVPNGYFQYAKNCDDGTRATGGYCNGMGNCITGNPLTYNCTGNINARVAQ